MRLHFITTGLAAKNPLSQEPAQAVPCALLWAQAEGKLQHSLLGFTPDLRPEMWILNHPSTVGGPEILLFVQVQLSSRQEERFALPVAG